MDDKKTKTCPMCQRALPLECFYTYQGAPKGYCKECQHKIDKQRRQKKQERFCYKY